MIESGAIHEGYVCVLVEQAISPLLRLNARIFLRDLMVDWSNASSVLQRTHYVFSITVVEEFYTLKASVGINSIMGYT